jgi:hypothetical protein
MLFEKGVGGRRQGDVRLYNRGGELDLSTLYATMKLSQRNLFITTSVGPYKNPQFEFK